MDVEKEGGRCVRVVGDSESHGSDVVKNFFNLIAGYPVGINIFKRDVDMGMS